MHACTREELDQKGCGEPGCGCTREIHFACCEHPDASILARYKKHSGRLELWCVSCKKAIGAVAVAWGRHAAN